MERRKKEEEITFEEFILCLPDDILHKYLVNFFERFIDNQKALIVLNKLNDYKRWIGGHFSWSSTKEGQDFWNDVYNKDYEKIAKHEF